MTGTVLNTIFFINSVNTILTKEIINISVVTKVYFISDTIDNSWLIIQIYAQKIKT